MASDDAGKPQAHQEENIDLTWAGDLAGFVTTEERPKPEVIKEGGAKAVAIALVGIFGATLFLVLLGATIILGRSATPDEAELYANSVVPLLESLGTFSSAVFSPLLAFVLGYYFAEKGKAPQK